MKTNTINNAAETMQSPKGTPEYLWIKSNCLVPEPRKRGETVRIRIYNCWYGQIPQCNLNRYDMDTIVIVDKRDYTPLSAWIETTLHAGSVPAPKGWEKDVLEAIIGDYFKWEIE